MEHWIGLLCAAFAAIAFGVQYAPVLWHLMTSRRVARHPLFIHQSVKYGIPSNSFESIGNSELRKIHGSNEVLNGLLDAFYLNFAELSIPTT